MAREEVKRPGYIITLKEPYKPGYVVCMAITPHRQDGASDVDPSKKLERDLGRKKALELAARLLAYCDAPADLTDRVWTMHAEAGTGDEDGEAGRRSGTAKRGRSALIHRPAALAWETRNTRAVATEPQSYSSPQPPPP